MKKRGKREIIWGKGVNPNMIPVPACPDLHQRAVERSPGKWVCGRCGASLHVRSGGQGF